MKFTLIVLFSLSLSSLALACSVDGKSGFLPENDLRIPVGMKSLGGLTLAQSNAAIKKVEVIYAPVVANMGGHLVINRDWNDDEVNAYARRDGKTWSVNMTGGIARYPTMTPDALALVVCHELGHHIGGAPKKKIGNLWSGAEGQADYFAALKCLRHVFLHDDNARIVKGLRAPSALVSACTRSHGSSPERDICVRIGMAGQAVGVLFQQLGKESPISFTTPDKSKVAQTFEQHPAAQCRLDTYFQGAICEKSMNENVSQSDEVRGTCHRLNGDRIGLRPACWFKSK
jgi:hypothetical protein